ncbi:MAG: hypothetical protein ACP5VN_02150 [Acidobacteriota bacterium]
MKRNLTLLGTFALALAALVLAVPPWAQCNLNYGVINAISGGQLEVRGTLDDGSGTGTIVTKFWMEGLSKTFHSGSLPSTWQAFPWGQDSYYIWSDWSWVGGIPACPPADRRTLFLYSIANDGAGQYLLASTDFRPYYESWDFDAITNGDGALGPNTMTPKAIPVPAVSLLPSPASSDVVTVGLAWGGLSDLYGFYDSRPASPLLTGIAVRYMQAKDAPDSFRTADWMLASFVDFQQTGGDPGRAVVQLPAAPGLKIYVALSLVFDGGKPGIGSAGPTETEFVGAPVLVPATEAPRKSPPRPRVR